MEERRHQVLETLKRRFAAAFGDPAFGVAFDEPARDGLAHDGLAHGKPAQGSFVFASAPGRLELAGNHTDHQGGRVISAALDARAYALAALNGGDEVRLSMEGFGQACIDLSDADWMQPLEAERGTPAAIARGMLAAFAQRGGAGSSAVAGFDVVTSSDIPVGYGVSSSAAFEMLMGACVEGLFGCGEAASFGQDARVRLALDGMEVERAYFGKMSGAQDQITSAVGGVVAMDFAAKVPQVRRLAFDAGACAYVPCLIDTRCDHSLCNDEYDAVPGDMFEVARLFNCERLADVGFEAFMGGISEVRLQLGDAKALRAMHFFAETQRVCWQGECLERADFEGFLAYTRLSGASSAQYLANVSPRGDGSGHQQPAMVTLALCAQLLGERGAWRIHGGGFGGSVLAFVPREELPAFTQGMNAVLGYDACWPVSFGAPGVCWEAL